MGDGHRERVLERSLVSVTSLQSCRCCFSTPTVWPYVLVDLMLLLHTLLLDCCTLPCHDTIYSVKQYRGMVTYSSALTEYCTTALVPHVSSLVAQKSPLPPDMVLYVPAKTLMLIKPRSAVVW